MLGVVVMLPFACQGGEQDGAAIALTFGHVPSGLTGLECPTVPAVQPAYKTDVEQLRLRVSGPGMKTMEQTYSVGAGEIQMDKVPVGENRNVMVTGIKGPVSAWRGHVRGVTVAQGETSEVSILLTKVADLTCSHNAMQEPRSFHTATLLADGRVLIAGGISVDQPGGTGTCEPTARLCRLMTATQSADIFDPATGRFTPTGPMANARAFHTAQRLADGRVVVVGGAANARLDTDNPFPIEPSNGVTAIEVFDPAAGTWSSLGTDPAGVGRTFAASSVLSDGTVLVTGGGGPNLWKTQDNRVVAHALNSSLLCTTNGCQAGPSMQMRRFGHVQITIADGSTMLFGGSVEAGRMPEDSGKTRQIPEFYNNGFTAPTAQGSYIDGTGPSNNVFFGSAMRVEGYGLYIVGGIARNDESDGLNLVEPAAQVWYVEETQRFMAVGTDQVVNGQPVTWKLAEPRFLAQLAILGDGTSHAVGGGYSNLARMQPSDRMEIFDVDCPSTGGVTYECFKEITVGGQPRRLRQARGAVAAVPLSGGTALFVGGVAPDTSGNPTLLSTAEIFTDTTEPPP